LQQKLKTYTKQASAFRAIPIIDTEQLLRFVPENVTLEEGSDCFVLPIPVAVGQAKSLQAYISAEPDKIEGSSDAPTFAPLCTDLVLCSASYPVERGYHIFIGTAEKPHLIPLSFRSAAGAGSKRSASAARIDWSTYERN